MKKIYITADAELNLLDYEQPKISLGDTAILELSSNINNEYSIRVDFNFDNEDVEYLRPMTLIDNNLWNYTIPVPVLQAVSSKNVAVTLETYITAYNIINNTINQNSGFVNKIGLYTTSEDLPLENVEVGVDYAIVAYENDGITVNENIWQYTADGWVDSELKEKLTSIATTTINIALDKFVQNSQELIDTTITDQILEEISDIENSINIGEFESKGIKIYDSDFSYSINSVTHDGDSFYKSLKNDNIGNALSDAGSWIKFEAATISDIEEFILTHNTSQESHEDIRDAMVGYKTIEGGEVFNDLSSNIASGLYSHAEGSGATASGSLSHAEGNGTTASGGASHAEGYVTTASGDWSHAEGVLTIASGGRSHAEGSNCRASGQESHAEGTATIAFGKNSHAEGQSTAAQGDGSHAEGIGTIANKNSSHAEGHNTMADGDYSHSAGYNTYSGYECQTVIGKFNDNKATTLFEVGNGTEYANKSNAFEVYLDGTVKDGTGKLINEVDAEDYLLKTNHLPVGTVEINKAVKNSKILHVGDDKTFPQTGISDKFSINWSVLPSPNSMETEKHVDVNIDDSYLEVTADEAFVGDKTFKITPQKITIDGERILDETDINTIDLSYTASTGILGIELKNQAGTTISSDSVDLPLELLIDSGTVETCTVDDEPIAGYVIGDKYLDLVLASGGHIYVLVSDLVDQITITETGTGNAVTDISINGSVITETKGKTFVETNRTVAGKALTEDITLASSDLTDSANLIKGATIYGGTISANFDTITKDGFYTGYGTATGAPNADYSWFVLHENSNAGTVSAKQTATAYNSSDVIIFVRVKMNSTWGAWVQSEIQSNKVTTISSSSTDSQYASAKCVYDKLETKLETVKVNGSIITTLDNTVDISIPTKTSDLTNDSNFTTVSMLAELSQTYTTTLPTTSGGASDWQAVTGGYELAKTISGLTIYDSIVSVADDDTIWTTNELNATITADTLTFFVVSLPSSEVGLTLTITKSTNGGIL